MTPIRPARLMPRQYLIVLFGLIMLWPAAINGGPFLFPDTTAYVRAIDAALVRTTGHRTTWSNDDVLRASGMPVPAVRGATTPARSAEPRPTEAKPVLLGRSVFYGALAFVGVLAGSLWVSIALQALLVGAVILALLRHAVSPNDKRFAGNAVLWTLALAATPLAWFTSMVMPDFLTGLAVIAAGMLVTGWQRETHGGRFFWLAVASYAALAHSSHVLILLVLAAMGLVIGVVRIPAWRVGSLGLVAAALLGLLGESAFVAAVTQATDAAPIRPPFLTARLVDDGPGTAYLNDHCPQARLLLCRYRDRLPMASDTFLWGDRGRDGVFKTLPIAEQRELAVEQGAFVRAVVRDRPLAVLASSFYAVLRQLGAWQLDEFNYSRPDATSLADHLPTRERSELIASRAFRHIMPTTFASMLILPWTLAGLFAIGLAWRCRWTWPACFGTALAAGWIVNTALCGALSTPHDRYQARVIWVMAVAALMIASSWRGSIGQRTATFPERRRFLDETSRHPIPTDPDDRSRS